MEQIYAKETLKKPNVAQLIAFAQVRQPIVKFKGRSPQYKQMGRIRSDIVDECMRLKDVPIMKCLFSNPSPEVDKKELDV